MANFAEGVYLAFAVPIATLVRGYFGKRGDLQSRTVWFVAGLTAVAVAVFFLTPSLPE